MKTEVRIKKLEKEVKILWRIIENEMTWHPTIVREMYLRSQRARGHYLKKKLRKAEEVFT